MFDGSEFEVESETNPRFALTAADRDMAAFYFAWRGGHILPDPGGLFDQAEAMIHAFEIMGAAEAWIDENRPERAG